MIVIMNCNVLIGQGGDIICTGETDGNFNDGILTVRMNTALGYNMVTDAYDNHVMLFLNLPDRVGDRHVTISDRNALNLIIIFQEVR